MEINRITTERQEDICFFLFVREEKNWLLHYRGGADRTNCIPKIRKDVMGISKKMLRSRPLFDGDSYALAGGYTDLKDYAAVTDADLSAFCIDAEHDPEESHMFCFSDLPTGKADFQLD